MGDNFPLSLSALADLMSQTTVFTTGLKIEFSSELKNASFLTEDAQSFKHFTISC